MEQRIRVFAQSKGFFSTVDLENFKDEIKAKEGIIKGLLRIQRTARGMAEKGVFIRRLDKEEKILRGFDKRYATYEYVGNEPMQIGAVV